jgi:hypothetical protein
MSIDATTTRECVSQHFVALEAELRIAISTQHLVALLVLSVL